MSFSLAPFIGSWPFLLKAIGVTLSISGLSMLLGFAIGVIVGSLRTYG
jgi:ABC-type amino acid transport system permease subunit